MAVTGRFNQDRGPNWMSKPDASGLIPTAITDEGGTTAEVQHSRLYVWNTTTLVWDRMTQPAAGGGGAGGPVTIVDGGDVAQGATTDASSANTVVGTLKAIKAAVQGTLAVSGTFWQATQPVSGPLTDAQLRAVAVPISATALTDGTQRLESGGATGAAIPTRALQVGGSDGTLLRAISVDTVGRQNVNVNGTVPVSGTFWQATQPVSIATMPSTPVTGTFWQATQPVSGTFFQATQPVSGTFFQATQPVSLATNTPDVTDRAARLLGIVDKGKIWDGTNIATVKAGVISVVGDNPIVVTLHPSSAPTVTQPVSAASLPLPTGAATSALQAPIVSTSQVSLLTTANTAGTLTIAASGVGIFHYISSIEIMVVNPTITAVAAAASLLAYTTTNLGSIAWSSGTLLAAGTEKLIARNTYSKALKSAVANTATTFVMPAAGAGTQVRINVTYYTA